MRDKEAQKRYISARAKGKSIRKAAKVAGISVPTAARAEKDPEIKNKLAKAFVKAGISDDRIAQKLSALMDAKKSVSVVSGKDAGSGTVDFVDVDDNPVQLKAVELVGKFRGDFIEKSEMDIRGAMTIRIRSNVKG